MKKILPVVFVNLMMFTILFLPFVVFGLDEPASSNKLIENPLKGDADTIPEVIALILEEIVMPIGAVIIVVMIIYSGFKYVTAQGDASKIKDAHNLFVNVLIGSAIILGATVIAKIIQTTLENVTRAI